MLTNPFVRDIAEYKRDLDVVGNAVADAAHFLNIQTGKSIEQCIAFVQKKIAPGGKFELKPRSIKMTKRQPNGDRIKHLMPFDRLIDGVDKTKSILSPNMVVYANPEKNLSFQSAFIDDNMAKRKVVKKKGQKAKMEGVMSLYYFCENQQTVIKTLNNSLSGAYGSPHNPVYNKTAHSTLTSATRIATSYGNAGTEKLLSGNRHYHNAEVTLNNIISITRHTDYVALKAVMDKYHLTYPTVNDCMDLIDRCTTMYWVDPAKLETVYSTVNKLTDLQRAAFAYTADLYHLAKFNKDFIKTIINELITRPTFTVENPDVHVDNCNGDIVALCGILCSDILAGMQVSKLKETNYSDYLIYASTVAHVNQVFDKIADFIKVFLVTDNMPASIYSFPASIRRVVVGSDTDSTMFTCQDWVEWFCGKLEMGLEGQRVSAAIMYFNTQMIAHNMAMISRQMGVVDKNMKRLEMKNEYSFLVYMVANRSKHYVTMINAKEGNIYKKPELDTKGVALKNSKIPPKIMKTSDNLIKMITGDIMSGKNIDIYPIMQRIANIEHEIFASLESGSIEYLSRAHIKAEGAYKKPSVSVYVHFDMWQRVFSDKYGVVQNPPYACVKVSNTLNTPKRFDEWINTMDPDTAQRMRNWLKSADKDKLGQFLVPVERSLNGIPKEFINAMDKRRIVKELMESFYIILEMCGFYFKNKHITRLLSDEIIYRPEVGSFITET